MILKKMKIDFYLVKMKLQNMLFFDEEKEKREKSF